MDLLDGAHVFFEVDDGVLPCLQSLREKAGGLRFPSQTSRQWRSSQLTQRTVLGSVSGTASSLVMLDMVSCRGGAADASGADISADFWVGTCQSWKLLVCDSAHCVSVMLKFSWEAVCRVQEST